MIRSMTGYYSKTFQFKTFSTSISIRALNHKYLEINFRGNVSWLGLEPELRLIAKDYFYRGKIDIRMDFELFDPSKFKINLNSSLLEEIIYKIKNIKKNEELVTNLDSLLKLPGVFNINYTENPFNKEETKFIKKSFMTALQHISYEREREGKKLLKHLKRNKELLLKKLKFIKKKSINHPKEIEKDFRERLSNFYKIKNFSESKFYEELTYYLEKSNINEEIERLETHLQYLDNLLDPGFQEPVGRKINFLMQECLREINTIGSKAQNKEISKTVVDFKENIENVREQIMNIE